MKTKILLLSILLSALFFSCSDTENPLDDGKQLTPLALVIDINDDGISDLKIEYNTTLTHEEREEMIGYIFPLGNSEFLTDENISESLFLLKDDSVTATPTAPRVFSDLIRHVISKKDADILWTVNSVDRMNPAYIGVKFLSGDTWFVGWAKIQFNIIDGEPELLATGYAENTCLIDE